MVLMVGLVSQFLDPLLALLFRFKELLVAIQQGLHIPCRTERVDAIPVISSGRVMCEFIRP